MLLPLGRKQRSLVHGTSGLFTLHTLLKAVIYCLQLNTGGVQMITRRWISIHRCSSMAVYVSFCIAQSNLIGSLCLVLHCCALLSPVNFPAVICLPFMPCCLSKESTSSELWTPVQSLPLIHLPLLLVYLLQTITFHTIQLILCYSKPVRLTTSLFVGAKS